MSNSEIQANNPDVKAVAGGLGVVKGLQVTGISAGFRKNPLRRDLALIVAQPGSHAAGVFTQNIFAAAPVLLSKEYLASQANGKDFRALVINSGNANAATGEEGIETAKETSKIIATALECEAEEVLVASTGVIGVQLVVQPLVDGLQDALDSLGAPNGESPEAGMTAAEAIMTTDTFAKTSARTFTIDQTDGTQVTCSIGGMAKGSGMIAPHMGTLIVVLGTDANIEQPVLQKALKAATDLSFNKVTIDSDTSTNDCAYLIATGAAMTETLTPEHAGYATFAEALLEVCQELAYMIAKDGEGATKVVVVDVVGAANDEEAELAARAIADSPLVKTAIAGHDANWGRIAMAIGKSGAVFKPTDVDISILDLEVFVQGKPIDFSEEEALKRFEERDEVYILVNLGAGDAKCRIWTCDLTHGYIEINGSYRT